MLKEDDLETNWDDSGVWEYLGGFWEDAPSYEDGPDELVDKEENRLLKLDEDLGGFLSPLDDTSEFESLHFLGKVEDKLGKCILYWVCRCI